MLIVSVGIYGMESEKQLVSEIAECWSSMLERSLGLEISRMMTDWVSKVRFHCSALPLSSVSSESLSDWVPCVDGHGTTQWYQSEARPFP
jgi:hypothetical protein